MHDYPFITTRSIECELNGDEITIPSTTSGVVRSFKDIDCYTEPVVFVHIPTIGVDLYCLPISAIKYIEGVDDDRLR